MNFLRNLFSRPPQPVLSASLPTQLLREGWKPYKFPKSDVIVILPQALMADFSRDGVLYASSDGKEPDFSATLHTDPHLVKNREFALEFISDLASKASTNVIDVATYRYFADPNTQREGTKEISFWVIGIPGAVVVVSLSRHVNEPYAESIEQVRQAIPQIVGELL
jgi:hypothetical protein